MLPFRIEQHILLANFNFALLVLLQRLGVGKLVNFGVCEGDLVIQKLLLINSHPYEVLALVRDCQ